jgi:hypothetical protein
MKDKNGKIIKNDDLVKVFEDITRAQEGEDGMELETKRNTFYVNVFERDCEIVGNMKENSELFLTRTTEDIKQLKKINILRQHINDALKE